MTFSVSICDISRHTIFARLKSSQVKLILDETSVQCILVSISCTSWKLATCNKVASVEMALMNICIYSCDVGVQSVLTNYDKRIENISGALMYREYGWRLRSSLKHKAPFGVSTSTSKERMNPTDVSNEIEVWRYISFFYFKHGRFFWWAIESKLR